jgi:pimeloyl-ACP methyl ester carboxylesterase
MNSFKVGLIFLFIFLLFIALPINLSTQQNSDYIPITFISEGSKISGKFFKAPAKNSMPTVILLHGFPGGDGDLFGLGKKLVKDSINAFTFSYRGMYKSEGIYLPSTSLEDIRNSVKFLRLPEISARYNIDTNQIVLLGYSYGSSLALLASMNLPSVDKIISIGTSDLSVVCNFIENNEDYRKGHQAYLDKYMADSTVARGLGGKASHQWLIAHKNDYNLVNHAQNLSNKKILLIAGWKDNLAVIEDHTIPFYRALQETGAENIKIAAFDTSHSFRNIDDKLYSEILEWVVR